MYIVVPLLKDNFENQRIQFSNSFETVLDPHIC
jgi:hypothetical protein